MISNQELTDSVALDLGIDILNRRPAANEIFNWIDAYLLPHSTPGTCLCEIYEWHTRVWSTTGNNAVGIICSESEIPTIMAALTAVPKEPALVPDFEFTKEEIIKLGLKLPSVFNISFSGDVHNAVKLSVKINGVKKSRLTNVDPLGMKIKQKLSKFSHDHPKIYRREIKRNYLSKALFYAESVEIHMEKTSGVEIGVEFETAGVEVTTNVSTDTHTEITLRYTGSMAPFAATLVKGGDFLK